MKEAADNILKAGRSIIRNTSELAEALYQVPVKAELLEVSHIAQLKEEIERWDVPQVSGIMGPHAICGVGDKRVMKRELPCFRECCQPSDGQYTPGCEVWSLAFKEDLISPNVLAVEPPAVPDVQELEAPAAVELQAAPSDVIEVGCLVAVRYWCK